MDINSKIRLYQVANNRFFYVCIDQQIENNDFSGRVYQANNGVMRMFHNKKDLLFELHSLIDEQITITNDWYQDWKIPWTNIQRPMKMCTIEVKYQNEVDLKGCFEGGTPNQKKYFKSQQELLELITRVFEEKLQQIERKRKARAIRKERQ